MGISSDGMRIDDVSDHQAQTVLEAFAQRSRTWTAAMRAQSEDDDEFRDELIDRYAAVGTAMVAGPCRDPWVFTVYAQMRWQKDPDSARSRLRQLAGTTANEREFEARALLATRDTVLPADDPEHGAPLTHYLNHDTQPTPRHLPLGTRVELATGGGVREGIVVEPLPVSIDGVLLPAIAAPGTAQVAWGGSPQSRTVVPIADLSVAD